MKAVAVTPGTADSAHLRDVPMPAVGDVPGGRGVLVRLLRVGVDGTDREIVEAQYGAAPPGDDFLIIGHESFGEVVECGPAVGPEFAPGTLVVAMVRRPGSSPWDRIGMQDMTTDETYYERGINLLHGFLAEYFVEDCDYLVPLPGALRETGVLLEPVSISEKGIRQAEEAQRRLKIWRARKAAVTGAGPIGMLAAMAMRLRGMDVTVYSRRNPPHLKADLLGEIGVHYVSQERHTFGDASAMHGPFDLVFEATGYSPLAWEAADVLAKNGVLVLSSVTGGNRTTEIPSDHINSGFVLGNKLMLGTVNAAREDFKRGVDDLIKAEALFPGWPAKLLTTPISGLGEYEAMLRALTEDRDAIKVYVEV